MTSLQERLRSMTEAPRRRQRGQIPGQQVAAALKYQQEFVHRVEDFNTWEICDCSESLQMLRDGKREARESRQMMWEDHYALQLQTEKSRHDALNELKLKQETAMLMQLQSDTDKWDMAIDLRLFVFIEASLSIASPDVKNEYFISRDKAGLPPMHRACKANDMQLVKLLLKFGANLMTKDRMEKSVFHVMAEFRRTELFTFLVTKLTVETQDILYSVDMKGYSLLHLAAANGSDAILYDLLSSSRRDVMKPLVDLVTMEEKRTALHLAALHGQIACVELLLKVAEAKADLCDKGGANALHLALQQTFDIEKLVTVFLVHTPREQQYATFCSVEEATGQSCLHTAIIKNFRQVTLALIRSGKVQINATTKGGGWSPLHLAVMTEEIDVVKELLVAGAMLDAIDNDGQTPLLQACLGGHLELVRLLLNAGANPLHQNKQAHSPLHYLAAFCRDRQLLRDIIANGADVNAKSMKLNTPMHFAAMNGNEVATQVLLENGASARMVNEDKRSVMYLANKWHCHSVEDVICPPDEKDGHSDVHSNLDHRKKLKSPLDTAHRQAQLRFTGRAHGASNNRPKRTLTMTSRSDSDSLFDFEDDELILPPSTPWPQSLTLRSNNNNNFGSTSMENKSCRSFSELRDRFWSERSPLKPVVLAQDRQKQVMDELFASSDRLNIPVPRFPRHLVVDPVHIPWEMTLPISQTSSADALTNQRKLKPSIQTNIGLLRDRLAHTSQFHWPR